MEMKKSSKSQIIVAESILLLVIGLSTISCIKNEIGSYTYSPTFSLPVGNIVTTFPDIAPNLQLYPAPEDSSRIDTIPVLYYNDILYYTTTSFDTIFYKEINFADMSDRLEMAEEIIFRINYANYFPTRVSGQVYFEDAAFAVVDSLFPDGPREVDAARVDDEGFVIEPTIDQVEVTYPREKIDRLNRVQFVAIFVHMDLISDNEIIRFYTDQRFEMQIGLRILINRQLNQE